MNIIYMHTHDTGRYIEPYGHAVPTPNLMQFAKVGTLFRNAYCAGPTCSPSRAGLLTGMAPHSCGMTGLAHRGFGLNDYSKHLVQYLNRNGFETTLCGVQHEAGTIDRDPSAVLKIGYQKILHEKDGGNVEWDMSNAHKAVEYIKSSKDKPFFLSFGMYNTHRKFPEISKDVNPNYVMPPFPMADTRGNREDFAAYITSAKVVDQCVGMVLDALEEAGLEEDTLVFFTTDHGIAFPRMKCNLYDAGIGVSLIIKYPGNKRAGEAVDSLISQIDIFPTLCDLLNLEKPEWLQGKSILPILEGEAEAIREELFSEVTFHVDYEPMRCIRTQRYKLIRFFDHHNKILSSNIDNGLSKSFLADHGYLDEEREKDMLFDLYLDPVERINLINDIRYKDILESLSNTLEKWMIETNDPLLSGKLMQN